ncbi:hypothetical protein C8F01DRAFT_1082162 [Mycena amicta]|nr:hypothetical protein C8F01DRAFT_1082162 [Mycena amicta]
MTKPLNLGEEDVLAMLNAYFKAASTRISELEEELETMKAKETEREALRAQEESHMAANVAKLQDRDREVKELTIKLAHVQQTCDELQAENDYLGAHGSNATFLHDDSQIDEGEQPSRSEESRPGDKDVNTEEDEYEEPQTPEMTATSHSGKDTAVL